MFKDFPDIQINVILAPYTTYKIGGPADYFYIAKNKKDLADIIIEARKNNIEYFVLGTGANILIGDKGFRGLVIKNEANNISINLEDEIVIAESGATVKELITKTSSLGLSGFEHFAGIPSTVGGAVWQNLHFLAPDRKSTFYIENIISGAEILDEENNILKVDKDFLNFKYDYSILHDRKLIITEVSFLLSKKSVGEIEEQITENLNWRNEKQPPVEEFPSCGSVFKKIENIGAGRLIDEVGLKGYKIGGAIVSEKHANFIINSGGASAKDVLDLIKFIQEKVFSQTGYKLETEIGLVGEF